MQLSQFQNGSYTAVMAQFYQSKALLKNFRKCSDGLVKKFDKVGRDEVCSRMTMSNIYKPHLLYIPACGIFVCKFSESVLVHLLCCNKSKRIRADTSVVIAYAILLDHCWSINTCSEIAKTRADALNHYRACHNQKDSRQSYSCADQTVVCEYILLGQA